MRLASLTLENFRNYESSQVILNSDCTVVVGHNASGKSNLIEAIRLLSTTHSIHARLESHLIKVGCDHTRLTGQLVSSERTQDLTCIVDTTTGRTRKTWKLAGVKRGPQAVVGLLPSVLFTPAQVELLQRSSAARRDFMDQLLVARNPELYETLQRLHYTLQQRQILLERARAGESVDCSIYTEQLIRDSAVISCARHTLIGALTKETTASYRELNSGTGEITLEVTNPVTERSQTQQELQQAYTQASTQLFQREVAAARNLVGAHRDDLTLTSNSRPLREFGSRGEWRSAILSLLISSLSYLEKKLGERPLLLLDDVFSELDPQHRAHLVPHLSQQQTILTCVDFSEVPKVLTEKASILEIENGTLKPLVHASS